MNLQEAKMILAIICTAALYGFIRAIDQLYFSDEWYWKIAYFLSLLFGFVCFVVAIIKWVELLLCFFK